MHLGCNSDVVVNVVVFTNWLDSCQCISHQSRQHDSVSAKYDCGSQRAGQNNWLLVHMLQEQLVSCSEAGDMVGVKWFPS
jgi:hypothetical protein